MGWDPQYFPVHVDFPRQFNSHFSVVVYTRQFRKSPSLSARLQPILPKVRNIYHYIEILFDLVYLTLKIASMPPQLVL